MNDNSIKILVLCLLILGIFLGAYEGIWKQGAKKVTNYNVKLTNEMDNNVYLEVIWDASGSMWGRDLGVEKIVKSREVLNTFTNEIPKKVNIGLRIFGARRIGDLKDSFLAIPFQKESRNKISNFITNVKPLGKSPIAYSLREARKDLAKYEGERYILLISDGIDNGQIPHEDIIQELVKSNIILHIVHIGEPDNKDLKNKLKKMAEKTGGKYFTYNEHKEVIPTFKQE